MTDSITYRVETHLKVFSDIGVPVTRRNRDGEIGLEEPKTPFLLHEPELVHTVVGLSLPTPRGY